MARSSKAAASKAASEGASAASAEAPASPARWGVGRLAQSAYDAVADLRHRCEDTVRSYISAGTFDGGRIGEAAARLEARLGVQDSQVVRGTLNFAEGVARSTKDYVAAKVEGLGFQWLKASPGGTRSGALRRSPPVALSLSSESGASSGSMRRSGSGSLLSAPGEDFFLEKPGGRKTFDKASFQRRPPRPPQSRLPSRAGSSKGVVVGGGKDNGGTGQSRLMPKAKSAGDLQQAS